MVSQDKYLGKVFPKPPIVAFKRPRNIRDIIIKPKLPKCRSRPTRQIKGMQTCPKNFAACPFVKKIKSVHYKQLEWKLRKSFDCQTYNNVYMIECKRKIANSDI